MKLEVKRITLELSDDFSNRAQRKSRNQTPYHKRWRMWVEGKIYIGDIIKHVNPKGNTFEIHLHKIYLEPCPVEYTHFKWNRDAKFDRKDYVGHKTLKDAKQAVYKLIIRNLKTILK